MSSNLAVNINNNFDSNIQNSDEHIKLWHNVCSRLHNIYGQGIFKNWIEPLYIYESSPHSIIFAAPTRFFKEWVIAHYIDTIKAEIRKDNKSILDVDVIIGENKTETSAKIIDHSSFSNINSIVSDGNNEVASINNFVQDLEHALDSRFTFENFIVGSSNKVAFNAAKAIAEGEKMLSGTNPLIIHGGVGLGKTHLMHSIAWHIRKNQPEKTVIYLSAEKFMYHFVKAIRSNDVMSFKEKLRNVDVFMIDDIQFICGKGSTQEEFFHTFNALIENKSRFVVACDKSPSDMQDLDPRIKSRLSWGLVVDIHSTTYELRMGILKSKLALMNVDIEIPEEVLDFIAHKITSNVRELEGALNKVVAHASYLGVKITLESAQDILSDLLRANNKTVTIEDIQKRVCEYFKVSVADILSSKRDRNISRPRQIAMYLCKKLTTRSLIDIGKKFGGKDHTTVMHAVKKVDELIKSDHEVNDSIRNLEMNLK